MKQLVTVVLLASSAASQLLAQVSPQRLEEQAQAYFDAGRFNGTALLAKDGKPMLSQGYGMANVEWNIPNAPDTKFRLGSITKQFTAMAVLLLDQQGKLKVEDAVCKYVDPCPDAWKPITIHHLLTHTSGIPNFTSFPDYTKTMMLASPPAESLKRFRDKPLDFTPGEKMSYSNSGYVLLGLIVEKAAGTKYDEYTRKNIFQPLGMKDTGYDWPSDVLPKRASGYEGAGQNLRNAAYLDMTIPHAAGSLYSTVLDLMKWDEALRAGKLLTPDNYRRYFTPDKNNYAYGWTVRTVDGAEVISHGGGINGFSTMIIRVPSQSLVAVTLSNVLPSQAARLAQDLIDLARGKEVAKPVKQTEVQLPAETLKKYVGEYALSPTFVLTVTLENGMLMTQATGQQKIPVFAKSERVFFLKVVEAELEFQVDEGGAVTGLILNQNGRKMPAKRK
ncbi:MAG: serine hydrolase [Acidobacteria bacterium]|nr:serine hydrolase [Acidobacteriota bacterium]